MHGRYGAEMRELHRLMRALREEQRRVLELVERYGAARVKGTMRKMIDTTAGVVGERLSRLPDGEWSDTRYVSGAVVGGDLRASCSGMEVFCEVQ